MTSQPQQEYIITEEQLKKIKELIFHEDEIEFEKIAWKIISRPAPSSALTQEQIATIRNQTLDDVIAFCKSNDCVQKTYGDKECVSTTDTECVICFCESLRRSPEEQRGDF